jgi:hypothetical protein
MFTRFPLLTSTLVKWFAGPTKNTRARIRSTRATIVRIKIGFERVYSKYALGAKNGRKHARPFSFRCAPNYLIGKATGTRALNPLGSTTDGNNS